MRSATAQREEDGEERLWHLLKSDQREQVRHRLFDLYAGFARALAWKQFNRRSHGDLEFQELHQLANTGLLEAIDSFDPQREVRFRAYAAHRITGSIADGIARMSEVRRQQSARAHIRRERLQSLVGDDMDALSDRDALEMLTELAMGLAVGVMLEGTGLYRDEGAPSGRTMPATAYDSAAWREMIGRLSRELAGLPEREQLILKRHYIDGVDFETVARLMSLSKGRISQLHRAALSTLRKRLARHGHFSLER